MGFALLIQQNLVTRDLVRLSRDLSYVHACAYDKWAGGIRTENTPPPTCHTRMRGRRKNIVSLARPSLKERGSGQTAIVELYR